MNTLVFLYRIGDFETTWILDVLLRGVTFDTVVTTRVPYDHLYPPGTLFVVSSVSRWFGYDDYFQQYERRRVPFRVIHLSDENYSHPRAFYSYRMCEWVWRNYWHPMFASKLHVRCFGLGAKNGVYDYLNAHPNPPWAQRTRTIVFAGNCHGREREALLRSVADHDDVMLHTTEDRFNSPLGLSVDAYTALLQSARFGLCPIGQKNTDSFRVYETLEAGSVPITCAQSRMQPFDYWTGLFGEPVPWINLASVEELWPRVRAFTAEDAARVAAFWARHRVRWASELAALASL